MCVYSVYTCMCVCVFPHVSEADVIIEDPLCAHKGASRAEAADFSKVSSTVLLYSLHSMELTFEDFCLCGIALILELLVQTQQTQQVAQKSALFLFFIVNLVASWLLRISTSVKLHAQRSCSCRRSKFLESQFYSKIK